MNLSHGVRFWSVSINIRISLLQHCISICRGFRLLLRQVLSCLSHCRSSSAYEESSLRYAAVLAPMSRQLCLEFQQHTHLHFTVLQNKSMLISSDITTISLSPDLFSPSSHCVCGKRTSEARCLAGYAVRDSLVFQGTVFKETYS